MQNSKLLIMAVTLMDFVTAVLILMDKHSLIVARLGIFYKLFSQPLVGALFMLVAVSMTLYGLTVTSSAKRFFLFVPQQIFLIMTTGSAIDSVIMQQYADGVIRSWQFILQDQLPSIVLAIGYFFAILDFEKKKAL